jgi:hypothetical protein
MIFDGLFGRKEDPNKVGKDPNRWVSMLIYHLYTHAHTHTHALTSIHTYMHATCVCIYTYIHVYIKETPGKFVRHAELQNAAGAFGPPGIVVAGVFSVF